MKNFYNKFAPVLSRISLIGLIVSLVALVGANIYLNYQTGQEVVDAWAVFYGSWAVLITACLSAVFAVVHLVFNFCAIWAWLREFLRKMVVSLKRKPCVIPLVMLFVAFLYYSLNLTLMSNTTAKIQGAGMGLSQFCIMLFSLLALVCMLNAFPRRKKANILMIVLMFVMFAIIIFSEVHYRNGILAALNRAESPIVLEAGTMYIKYAYDMLFYHMILMGLSAGLVLLLPVYSKLLKKINTSVAVEDNGEMAQIEITDEA